MKLNGKYDNMIKGIIMILNKRMKLFIRQRLVHEKILLLNLWFINQWAFSYIFALEYKYLIRI